MVLYQTTFDNARPFLKIITILLRIFWFKSSYISTFFNTYRIFTTLRQLGVVVLDTIMSKPDTNMSNHVISVYL